MSFGKLQIAIDIPNTVTATIKLTRADKDKIGGECFVKVPGVKDFILPLTPDEVTHFMNLITRTTQGAMKFETDPPDILTGWKAALEESRQQAEKDVTALEAQTVAIEGLRADLAASTGANGNSVQRIRELTEELRQERAKKDAPTQQTLPTVDTVTTVPEGTTVGQEAAPTA